MSWQDREYAKGASYDGGWTAPSAGGAAHGWWRRSVINKLMLINTIVFVLCLLTASSGRNILASPICEWGVLEAGAVLRHGQVWRLVTATFLHISVWHLALNMFGLWMFGRPVENAWGSRMALAVYLISGVLGNVMYLALTGYLGPGILLGASGCVLAMLGAAAVMFPHMSVYVFYGLFPMPVRVLALIFAGLYLVNALQRGANAGGDVCHLVGLAVGSGWAWRGRAWWLAHASGAWERIASGGRGSHRPARQAPRYLRASEFERDQAELDALLARVKQAGLEALSAQERRRLQEISERMRADYTRR